MTALYIATVVALVGVLFLIIYAMQETSSRNMNVLLAELVKAHDRENATLSQVQDVQAQIITDQRSLINTFHARVLLPTESAAVDIQKETTTAPPQPYDPFGPVMDFANAGAELPNDLDQPIEVPPELM